MRNAEYILKTLGKEEILCQLAEEAAELSQAALKLRRALTQKNPTPVPAEEAAEHLEEEIADVCACLDVLFEDKEYGEYVDSIYGCFCLKEERKERWANRIRTRSRKKDGKQMMKKKEKSPMEIWRIMKSD